MVFVEANDIGEFTEFLADQGNITLNPKESLKLLNQILAVKDKEIEQEKMKIAARRKQLTKPKHHSIIPNDNQIVDKTLPMPNPENEVLAVL